MSGVVQRVTTEATARSVDRLQPVMLDALERQTIVGVDVEAEAKVLARDIETRLRNPAKKRTIGDSELEKPSMFLDLVPSAQYSMQPAMWSGSRVGARSRPSSCHARRLSRQRLDQVSGRTLASSPSRAVGSAAADLPWARCRRSRQDAGGRDAQTRSNPLDRHAVLPSRRRCLVALKIGEGRPEREFHSLVAQANRRAAVRVPEAAMAEADLTLFQACHSARYRVHGSRAPSASASTVASESLRGRLKANVTPIAPQR